MANAPTSGVDPRTVKQTRKNIERKLGNACLLRLALPCLPFYATAPISAAAACMLLLLLLLLLLLHTAAGASCMYVLLARCAA